MKLDTEAYQLALSQKRAEAGLMQRGGSFFMATTFAPSQHPRSSGGQFIQAGSSGVAVRKVQKKLGIKTDGTFGPQTTKAVKQYQRQNNLLVDGIIGSQTAASLTGASSEKPGALQPGQVKALKDLAKGTTSKSSSGSSSSSSSSSGGTKSGLTKSDRKALRRARRYTNPKTMV